MLTLKQIRDKYTEIKEGLIKKNFKNIEMVDQVIDYDNQRKETQKQLDNTSAELNNISKKVGKLFQQGEHQKAEAAKQHTLNLKEEIKQLTDKLREIELKLEEHLVLIPNIPHLTVPPGKTADENEIIRTVNTKISETDNKLSHWDLAKKYDIIDFELGVKITGAGFPVYKGKGARLQRALINFFLDQAQQHGYTEVQPPILVNEESGFGTGNLPDKEGQMYLAQTDRLYLIPTAEVPVTNIFRDTIIDEKDLPVKLTAYTPCFRREAGSYGKDVRGLNRLHQFDKVEIVCLAHPEKSYEIHSQMVSYVESLIEKLQLPYRIVKLCGGDMSFTAALTYDFEVWSSAQNRWLEVSSVSNFESFQSNRLKCRYRDKETKKTNLAHTLNGSALALPRIVAAMLENNQTPYGITIPEVLIPYTGFSIIN